jgi:transaldolase
MYRQAKEIAWLGENIIVKIPGSEAGYRLIEELTSVGIGTNNTISFTVSQYDACMNAVSRGLKKAEINGVDMNRWRSVITHMSARLGSLGDLKNQAAARGIDLSPSDIRWAEIAVYKKAYALLKKRNHPSKMLQCSMRIDDDVEPGRVSSWHIQKIAGSDSVYTCPPNFVAELMAAEDGMAPFDSRAIDEPVPKAVIDKLMRIPYFTQAYEIGGMDGSDFGQQAAFIATAAESAAATRAMLDFVANQFEAMGGKKKTVETA